MNVQTISAHMSTVIKNSITGIDENEKEIGKGGPHKQKVIRSLFNGGSRRKSYLRRNPSNKPDRYI